MILLFFLCYIYFMNFKKKYFKFFIILLFLIINACGGNTQKFDPYKSIYGPKEYEDMKKIKKSGSILKDLFVGKKDKSNNIQSNNLKINPFLWQASLDILSTSIPLVSIDSTSGIIISDWYSLKRKPNERVKISVLVKTKELRADGLSVKVFKQVLRGNSWESKSIDPNIAISLERKIIQKAGILSNQKE